MANELIIHATSEKDKIVVLKHGKIVEYYEEAQDKTHTIDDVYLAKVTRVVPNLNACFVNLGHERDGFLHYSDLGATFPSLLHFIGQVKDKKKALDLKQATLLPKIPKDGNISTYLKPQDQLVAPIPKEAISTKGLRLAAKLALSGRYLILVPFGNQVILSRKIQGQAERTRLQQLLTAIRPKNCSIIVRTVAQERSKAELQKDLEAQYQRWQRGVARLAQVQAPKKVIGSGNRLPPLLRELLHQDFHQIITDDLDTYHKIKDHLGKAPTQKAHILQHFQGKTNLLEHFNLVTQIKALFNKVIPIEGGGSIIIEQTEAMCVIDVNSGLHKGSAADQEHMALEVNLAASKTIARLLRSRNIGGIIVVDLISMKTPEHKKKVYQHFKELVREDRARINVLPPTRLCLMQITRERVRPAIHVDTTEPCPSCLGSGTIEQPTLLVDDLAQQLRYCINHTHARYLAIMLHPYLYAYLTRGFYSVRSQWCLRYHCWIRLIPKPHLPVTAYQIFNAKQQLLLSSATLTNHQHAKPTFQ